MYLLPKPYVEVLKRRDFLVLTLVILVGQIASAFLVLSLIVSIYTKTGSNFGVSGVILSFAIPAFLLMAFAGAIGDIFDRKKTILFANVIISFVVLLILLNQNTVYGSTALSFLYFAGNSFFIPASSAATGQLVRKKQLLVANSIFIFVLAGGVLFGFFAASIIHFIFDGQATLVVCELLLIFAVILSITLPSLPPRRARKFSFTKALLHLKNGFFYIYKAKAAWVFFLTFALMQGLIVFAVTLAPGFLEKIIGLSINTSPMIVLPPVAAGVLLGLRLIQIKQVRESVIVSVGVWSLGFGLLLLGLIIKSLLPIDRFLAFILAPFLIVLGFGAMIVMVASRSAIQRAVPHNHQGTVFGANIILASFLSVLMSPLSVVLENILGYVNLLLLGGAFMLAVSMFFTYFGNKWRF